MYLNYVGYPNASDGSFLIAGSGMHWGGGEASSTAPPKIPYNR